MNHPLNHFRFSLRALLRVIIILLFWMSALNELKCLKSVVRLIMTWMGSRCHMVNQLSGAPFFFFFIAFSSITSSLYFTFPALNVRFIKLQDVEFLWLLNLQYVTNAHPNTDTDSKFEKIESHSSEEGVLCPLKVFSFSVWTAFKSCFKIRIVPFLLLKS